MNPQHEDDYLIRMINLPGDIHAVLRIDNDGFGNIYINDQLSPMAKRTAILHELNHLKRGDMTSDSSIYAIESA